jgi:hypothetical protein
MDITILKIKIRSSLLRLFRRIDQDSVYFEGGLGSQILAYCDFLSNPRNVNLSYFKNPPTPTGIGPDIWKWELDRYGIELSSLFEYEKNRDEVQRYTLRETPLETALKILQEKAINQINYAEYKDKFPINKERLDSIAKKIGIKIDGLTMIHIRRGDYERVASKVVGINEYVDFLNSISTFILGDVLFASDTELESQDQERLKKCFNVKKVLFFFGDQLPNGITHDLMRSSSILITANSTFSISAGFLSSERTLVFSPIEFFGGADGYIKSRIFNRYGEFFVLRN